MAASWSWERSTSATWHISHGDHARLEHRLSCERQRERCREPLEQQRPAAGDHRMRDELVLVYQSGLRNQRRQRHAPDGETVAWLILQLTDGGDWIARQQLGVMPVHAFERARDDVLLRGVD